MTNQEKFETAEERDNAFKSFCHGKVCVNCEIRAVHPNCTFKWLELEAEEEKPLPCPFCGKEVHIEDSCTDEHPDGWCYLDCDNPDCYYSSGLAEGRNEAIAAHNRICRAVMDSKKEGEKK